MNTIKNKKEDGEYMQEAGYFYRQIQAFEKSRFAWMAIYITFQSCLGSIACMYILKSEASDFALAACGGVTMACNSVFIAQGPANWCLLLFYASVILNTVFILMYI